MKLRFFLICLFFCGSLLIGCDIDTPSLENETEELSTSATGDDSKDTPDNYDPSLCEDGCPDTCGTSEGISPGFIAHNRCVNGQCDYHYATYCEYGTETCTQRDGPGRCVSLESIGY